MAGRKGPARKKTDVRTKTTRPTRDPKQIFLEHLRLTANVSESARIALRERSTVYQWRDSDGSFAAAWDDALDEATDALEYAARQRAVHGVEEYVVSGGRLVMDPTDPEKPLTQRKYSDTLAVTLLKAHRPEKFRERHDIKQSGAIAINITSDDDAL